MSIIDESPIVDESPIIDELSIIDGSPRFVTITNVHRRANMLAGDVTWRKPPFYFGLSTDFLHSTHSYYPEPEHPHAGQLRKCNTTSVFPGRPTSKRLLLCSGTSPGLRARIISTFSRITLEIGSWSQVARGTRAFWATKYSRGESSQLAVAMSTFTGLYSLRKWREMNEY